MPPKQKAYAVTDYVEKAHPLVEAKYSFSIWEMRIFGLVVANTDKKDLELQQHRFYLADMVREFGVSKSAYPEIKKAVKKLQAATLRIPYQTEEGYERYIAYNVTSISTMPKEYGEIEDNDYIEIKLSNDIKDFVIQMKSYLKYHKKNLLYVKTPYSMRLYELLKRYEFRNERTIEIAALREKLGIQ